MYDGELQALIALVASVTPRTVIEFGVNAGRTAKAILRNVPGIQRYIGIDVPRGYQIGAVQRREVPEQPGCAALDDRHFRLLLARNGSHDLSVDDLPYAEAIFIDGDHSKRGVLNDYALARQRVCGGGIIIFHDDNGLDTIGVSSVLDELSEARALVQHVEGTWLAFQRF